jgi:hypothetical protein
VQDVSVNYNVAATGAGGVWADPKLSIDWMQDGYDITPNLMDSFNRNLTDVWGSTDTGQAWINTGGTAAEYDVVFGGTDTLISGYGSHTVVNVTGTYQTRSSVLNGPLVFVTRQITKLQMPVPTADNIESLSYYRFIDVGNHYRAGVVILPGGTVTIAIVRAVGGVETVLANNIPIGLTYTGDPQVLVSEDRMLADGTLQARAYIEGTAIPDWQVTVQDTDQILTSGVPGLRTTVYPGNTNVRPIVVKYVSYEVVNGLPDDVSAQAGGWSVTHHLDDGYPDAVTFISGVGTPELVVDIGPPPPYLTDNMPQTSAEYYSPYNTRSPIYGRERDVSPVKLEHGVVTASGAERVPVFTGQMADLPVKRGKATLSAVSATRMKLSKLVQPPAVNGAYQGANATWPISYALAACGVYASPPPQSGCRYWAPMHGSIKAFIPSENQSLVDMMVAVRNLVGPYRSDPIKTIEGPYLAAIEYGVNFENGYEIGFKNATLNRGIFLEDGPDLATGTGKGKVEMWVRGDATNLNAAPSGSASVATLIDFYIDNNDAPNTSGLEAWLNPTTRKLHMFVKDGFASGSVISDVALPTDGAWHFCGWAWDITTKKVWVNLDGTVKTATIAAIDPVLFPTTEDFATTSPFFRYRLPAAEVQVTGGVSPDTVSWLRDIPFTPQARVTPSVMELANVAESEPEEAWSFLASYAKSELASMRTDELDVFNYLGFGWWVKDAQQLVEEIYSTEFNTSTIDINIDPTKIRNEIIVTFEEVLTADAFTNVFTTSEPIAIPPGITTLILSLSKAAFELRNYTFTSILAATTVQPINVNSVSFNGSPDGTGFYYSTAYVTANIVEWNPGSATVEIDNDSTITLYLANDKNWPSLTVAAKSQESSSTSIMDTDATSVLRRGERSLAVSASRLQTRVNARRLARRLKMALRDPQPAAEELVLFGDARRQPGDLVTFEDPSMTKVSGLWRAQSVSHDLDVSSDSIEYTNGVILRPTREICVVGTGRIGQTLVGPKE